MSSTMRLNSDEAKTYQGFGKRTTSITKVSAPPGGHTQFNLFSEEPDKPIQHEVKPCQYERNKSSITDQYTGTECKESPEKKPAPVVQTQVAEHLTPPPKTSVNPHSIPVGQVMTPKVTQQVTPRPNPSPVHTSTRQVTQHATPPKSARHTSTRVLQAPGGACSLNLFG